MNRTRLHYFISVICISFLAFASSCVDECKECTFYEVDDSGNITSELKLDGEYCGDEWKAQEAKEYQPATGEAYTECE